MHLLGRTNDATISQLSHTTEDLLLIFLPEPLQTPVFPQVSHNPSPIVYLYLSVLKELSMRMHIVPLQVFHTKPLQILQRALSSAIHVQINVA